MWGPVLWFLILLSIKGLALGISGFILNFYILLLILKLMIIETIKQRDKTQWWDQSNLKELNCL